MVLIELGANTIQQEETKEVIKLIERFLTELNSENTRKAYKHNIKEFYEFKSTRNIVTAINRKRITEYRDWLIDKGLSAKTVRPKIGALSSLFQFLVAEGVITKNPCEAISLPVVTKGENETDTISKAQVKKLFKLGKRSTPNEIGMYLGMKITFKIACRVSEMANLKIKNLIKCRKKNRWQLEFRQKGNSFRQVYISDAFYLEIKESLKAWQDMTKIKLNGDDYLVQARSHRVVKKADKPMRRATFDSYLKSHSKLIGVENLSSHMARATVITELCNSRLSTREIAKLAGCSEANVMKYNRGNLRHADMMDELF